MSEKAYRIAEVLLNEPLEDRISPPARGIEEKYLKHAFRHKFMSRNDLAYRRMYLPSCGKCESAALRDRRPGDPLDKLYVTCPICHYHGPAGPPIYKHVKEV